MSDAATARQNIEEVDRLIKEQRTTVADLEQIDKDITEKTTALTTLQNELNVLKKQEAEKKDRIGEISEELAALLTGKKPDGRKKRNKKTNNTPAKKATPAAEPVTTAAPAEPAAKRRRSAVEPTAEAEDGDDVEKNAEIGIGLEFLKRVIGPHMPEGLKGGEIIAQASHLGYSKKSKDAPADCLALFQKGVEEGWIVKGEDKKYTLTDKAMSLQPA